jgi:hypothetical protein
MNTPNSSQAAAADKFFNFLLSEEDRFILSGGAGVGKTWLMGYFSDTMMQTYADACKVMGVDPSFDNVVFTATTNKAAEVLEHSTGKPVQTIHSYLGLKVKENFSTGKTTITKTHNYMVRDGVVLFIDESSMIDSELYDLIMKSFTNSKIIFVGDHAQMAPVNEASSKVYDDIPENHFVFLDQPVRNANSPALIALCADLRDTVETGKFHSMDAVPGHVEYLSSLDMQTKLKEVFAADPNPSARILSFTNSRVQDYNSYIRDIRGLTEQFSVGDIAVIASAYNRGKVSLSVEREMEIISIDTVPQSLGYQSHFTDEKPLTYLEATVGPPGSGIEVPVRIALDKPRWKEILKKLSSNKMWHDFFELKAACIDLRDKAACTVYKSQGSTYDTVFLDIGNIGTSFDAVQVARMLFVGASRSTTKVYLFGDLPPKYKG